MSMQALRVVMLLVTVAVCYLLFFHSQPTVEVIPTDPASSEGAVAGQHAGSPATVHTQYKEAMNRAHAAAKAMQDERKEADSY